MKIELSEFEQRVARVMADLRRDSNVFLDDSKIGKQPWHEMELEGCGSELAAAKALNVYPDLTNEEPALADLIFHGNTVDVKVTKYKSGKLLAPLNKKNKSCDLYVLVIGQFPNYEVVGVATKEMLISKDSVIDVGYGRTYGLQQHDLIPIKDFLELESC